MIWHIISSTGAAWELFKIAGASSTIRFVTFCRIPACWNGYHSHNCSQFQGGLYIADLSSTSIISQESMMCSNFLSSYITFTDQRVCVAVPGPDKWNIAEPWRSVPKVCITCVGVVVLRVVDLYRARSTISRERSAIRHRFKMDDGTHLENNRTGSSSVSRNASR